MYGWWSINSYSINSSSLGSVSSSTHYEVTATPVELGSGEVKVGNITFDPQIVLGKGCEGTFVYKVNDGAAIKMLLSDLSEERRLGVLFNQGRSISFIFIAIRCCLAFVLMIMIMKKYKK